MSQMQAVTETRSRPVPERIVTAVADAMDVEPTDLTPLYDTIDPDSLAAVLASESVDRVDFSYHGFDVTAHSDGRVELADSRA